MQKTLPYQVSRPPEFFVTHAVSSVTFLGLAYFTFPLFSHFMATHANALMSGWIVLGFIGVTTVCGWAAAYLVKRVFF
jgi:hypothetical protein